MNVNVKENGSDKERIEILDSFRCLAILLVLFFHYFNAFQNSVPQIYPYGSKFADVAPFKYGYLGVEFFFIISGFVIFMTLGKCTNFKTFAIKRLIRLLPPILFCSILTFVLVRLLDPNNVLDQFHTPTRSFLPSITFTEPGTWSKIFRKDFSYVDGVYWSLAVEVKFYIVAAFLYFFSKKSFFSNWIILCGVVLLFQIVVRQNENLSQGNSAIVINIIHSLLFTNFFVFFTMGMLFYKLYKQERVATWQLILLLIYSSLQILFVRTLHNNSSEKYFYCLFISLFLIFIYKPKWLAFLSLDVIRKIGISSYPLYLVHQFVGIVLIYQFSTLFNNQILKELTVIPVIVIIILLSFIIHNKVEKRMARLGSRFFLINKKVKETTRVTSKEATVY